MSIVIILLLKIISKLSATADVNTDEKSVKMQK